MDALLNGMYEWGLNVIRLVQSPSSPVLTCMAKIITLFGDPAAYIIALPIIFWCVSEKRGFRLGFVTLFSAGINLIIKENLRVPRPFTRDPSVGIIHESGFSTPSAHAQVSATFWGYVAVKMKSKWKWAVGLAIPFVIGLSRVYLGVHYPTDVLLGWLLGAVIVTASYFLIPIAEKYLAPMPFMFRILILAALAFIMNALSMTDTSLSAALFGFGAGYALLLQTGGYDAAAGRLWQKLLRVLIGFAGIALLFLGLTYLLPGKTSPNYQLYTFLRFLLVGAWGSFFAPKIFMACRLAKKYPALPENA